MSTIKQQAFVGQFTGKGVPPGVVDTNHLSEAMQKALDAAGVPPAELKKLAGADGQIRGDEFNKLFALLDGFDGSPGNKVLELSQDDGTPTPVGQLNDALKDEVARNLKASRYAVPGSVPAAAQPRTTAAGAVVVSPKDRQPVVKLDVKGKDQFVWGAEHGFDEKESNHKCADAALSQTTEYLTRAGKPLSLDAKEQAIQVAYAEDSKGRLEVDSTQMKLGHEYIDRALDAGYPVLVGVSCMDMAINADKLTDHFVTISGRGYDAAGHLFYEFKDPGAGGRTDRFLVDEKTGKLFREGAKPDARRPTVLDLDYEVTRVFTYKGL